jgi:hypothetical protein
MGKPIFDQQALATLTDTMESVTLEALSIATDEQYVVGLTWYQNRQAMLQDWAEQYGRTLDQTAAIMAVLSPQVSYRKNVAATFNVITDRPAMHGLGLGVRRAQNIAAGQPIESNIGGKKVRSFFHNLRHPMDHAHVTIDVWMGRLAGLESQKDLERKGAYEAIAEGVRRAAKRVGIVPCQAQAIAWIVTRGAAF